MSPRWSRRAFLAGAGMAAVAGCLSQSGQSPTPTLTPTGTSTGTGTATASATPTPPDEFDTEWPVPAADVGRSNHAAGAAGPIDRVDELWRHTAETTFSMPVVVDATVYVAGQDGSVRALDARSGEERWRQSVGGPAAAPWVVDDRLYVPAADGLVALHRDDGSVRWRVPTPGRAAVSVAAHGLYWLDGQAPAVVALEHADGAERWRTAIEDPWAPTLLASDGSVFVSSGPHDFRFWTLAVDTGAVRGNRPRHGHDFPAEQVYMDGTMYAVDAFFGNVKATDVDGSGSGWTQGVSPGGEAGGGQLSGGTQHVYYTSTVDDEPDLYALARSDGTVAWTTTVGGTITGRPVVAGEAVLVPTDGGIRCVDPTDGTERWRRADIGPRCLIVDDVVYAAGDGTVRAFRAP